MLIKADKFSNLIKRLDDAYRILYLTAGNSIFVCLMIYTLTAYIATFSFIIPLKILYLFYSNSGSISIFDVNFSIEFLALFLVFIWVFLYTVKPIMSMYYLSKIDFFVSRATLLEAISSEGSQKKLKKEFLLFFDISRSVLIILLFLIVLSIISPISGVVFLFLFLMYLIGMYKRIK